MFFLLEFLQIFFWFFLFAGLPVLIPVIYEYATDRYEDYIKGTYSKTQKFVILRVFPPQQNINSMHKMEEFFNSFWSTYRERTPYKLYTLGRSYETVIIEFHSIGGFVGIFVRINQKNQEVFANQLIEKFPGTKIVETVDPFQDMPKEWTRKGKYTQIYAADIKTLEITTDKETDLFPLKSWKNFQTDANQPITDPANQLFSFLQNIDSRSYVVLQFVLRPLVNKKKIDDWQKEYHKRKKEFSGDENEVLTKKQKMLTNTKTQTSILEGITRKIHSLNYICKIRAVAMAEDGVDMETLRSMISSFFVQFNSEMVKMVPQSQTETIFKAGGKHLDILGPDIDTFFGKKTYEKERYWRERMVYDGLKRRHIDVGSKSYYLDTQSLAAMIHFPFITPEVSQARNIKAETQPEQGVKYQHLFKAQPPEGLPS